MGQLFLICESHLTLVCCCLISAVHFQPIGSTTGAAFKTSPELHVPPQRSKMHFSCREEHEEVVEAEQAHCHGLVVAGPLTQVYLRFLL